MKRLRFVLKVSRGGPDMLQVFARFMPNGRYVLNRTEWMAAKAR